MTPILRSHNGIIVVRDDLFPGGTKARFIGKLFESADELCYASPAEGGAQTAIAHCAKLLSKRATIFVAKRAKPHPRSIMAKALGATVYQVTPGYLAVVQDRARKYCLSTGATLIPFGANVPGACEMIAAAATRCAISPDEVWCAAGSGVLARGLAIAWPNAIRHAVQVGRALSPRDVAGATIHIYPRKFGQEARISAPFPSDPHYDAKAWEICAANANPNSTTLFWNVSGPAQPNL